MVEGLAKVLRLAESVGFDGQRGRDDDRVGRAAGRVRPGSAGEIGGLLQHKPGTIRRPRNACLSAAEWFDGEQRSVYRLNGEGQGPETADEGEGSTGHRTAGIGLTDSAGERVDAAGAGAAAPVDGEPVDAERLRGGR